MLIHYCLTDNVWLWRRGMFPSSLSLFFFCLFFLETLPDILCLFLFYSLIYSHLQSCSLYQSSLKTVRYVFSHHYDLKAANSLLKSVPSKASSSMWPRSVVVITTAQIHLTKSELRFYAGSNSARGLSEICNGENLREWSRLEIRWKRVSSVNHSAKAIYHLYDHHFRWSMWCDVQDTEGYLKVCTLFRSALLNLTSWHGCDLPPGIIGT